MKTRVQSSQNSHEKLGLVAWTYDPCSGKAEPRGAHQPASPVESVSSEFKDTPVSKQKFFNGKSNRGSTQRQTPRDADQGLSSSRAAPAWTWGTHIFSALCHKCHSSLPCFPLKLNVSGHIVNSKFFLKMKSVLLGFCKLISVAIAVYSHQLWPSQTFSTDHSRVVSLKMPSDFKSNTTFMRK